MSDLRKVHTGDIIFHKESDEMAKQLSSLISRHNVLCSVENAVNESDEILAICNEVMAEMEDAGNASMGVLLALTIEAANEKIKELKQENDELYAELASKK